MCSILEGRQSKSWDPCRENESLEFKRIKSLLSLNLEVPGTVPDFQFLYLSVVSDLSLPWQVEGMEGDGNL